MKACQPYAHTHFIVVCTWPKFSVQWSGNYSPHKLKSNLCVWFHHQNHSGVRIFGIEFFHGNIEIVDWNRPGVLANTQIRSYFMCTSLEICATSETTHSPYMKARISVLLETNVLFIQSIFWPLALLHDRSTNSLLYICPWTVRGKNVFLSNKRRYCLVTEHEHTHSACLNRYRNIHWIKTKLQKKTVAYTHKEWPVWVRAKNNVKLHILCVYDFTYSTFHSFATRTA